MIGHTMRYGAQRSVDVCSVLRNMCSLCRKGRAGSPVSGFRGAGSPVSGFRGLGARFLVSGFKFHVSGTPLLCPPKIGVTSPQGGGGMPNGKRKGGNGKVKTENGTPIAHTLFFYRPLRRFAPPLPNLGEESGGMPNGKVKTER